LPSKIDINYSDNPREYKLKWQQEYIQNNPDNIRKITEQNETRKEYKAEWHQQTKEKIHN
jgi:hypothetical protein